MAAGSSILTTSGAFGRSLSSAAPESNTGSDETFPLVDSLFDNNTASPEGTMPRPVASVKAQTTPFRPARNQKAVKLAASIAMNPHYHPYSDLSSPHSPSPDNAGSYAQLTPHHNGHGGGGGGGGGGGNGPNNMVSQMDGQQGFHQMNSGNGGGPVKHCAGCGGKITERFFLHALDRYWHNSCLKCSCCGAMLADIGSSCYTRSGMILCKADYSSHMRRKGCVTGAGLSK
ncbi:hypothetical protein AND_002951 [Anopheles darlingi]|uniref:LIM zinc-binding domain-containing protein n=1 Tax=Anopheles darlingi TaxID=43151 RepID=W5JRA4_ANODA|nr:hypothetical protein AND_002951 [Anopheles darlingi]